MKKIFLIIMVLLTTWANAQYRLRESNHKIAVIAGGGLSFLNYHLEFDGEKKPGFAGTIGAAYEYSLNNQWRLHTGINLAYYSAKAEMTDFSYEHPIIPSPYPAGDYRLQVSGKGFQEKQSIMYLNIPLMMKYLYPLKKKVNIYAMGGLKFGIPISSKFNESIDQYTTKGYSSYSHQTHENEPDHGFSTYYNQTNSGSLDLKFNASLAFEIGCEWILKNTHRFSTGIYFDYGLNNIASGEKASIINYHVEKPSELQLKSITAASDKINLMAAGVMVRYTFNAENPAVKAERARREAAAVKAARLVREQQLAAKKARRDSINEVNRLAELERQAEIVRAKALQDSIDKANIVHVTGIVRDQKTNAPIGAVIKVTNNTTGATVQTVNTDPKTGKYAFDLKRGADYGITAKKDGYLFKSQNINLKTQNDEKQSITINIYLGKIEKGAKSELKNTFYESGKTDLTPESEVELENIILLLNQNPNIRLEISGHTDNVGSAAANKKISEARAQSVVNYLVKKGIDPKRLKAVGYGFDQPVSDNNTEEGRAKNRRTEIKIIE